MGGKGGGTSQRPVTQQEKDLWESQAKNLDSLTRIAEDQYDLSVEDREYYEKVFREGSDTEAKDAIAKLRSMITGETVSPSEIESANIDTLLRDMILTATPEFQKLAGEVVSASNTLTSEYGAKVTGLSESFSKGIQDLSTNYSQELQQYKEQTGTINQDVLSREVGSATAGISSAFAEARKQMEGTLAQRGLEGSGIANQMLGNMFQQEAMAKASATSQARGTALQQSEAIRQQQMGISGSQLQAGVSGLQTGYQANMGAAGNVYGVTSANLQQGLQTTNAGILQGIGGLTQAAQAGTGVYAGAQNYLAQAGSSAGQGASIAGNSAAQIGQMNSNWALEQQKMKNESAAGIGKLVGTIGGAMVGGPMGASMGAAMFGGGK